MKDIKELISDFYDSVNEKIGSPFVLAFVTCWLLHNWKLVAGMLCFDDTMLMQNKLDFIACEIEREGWRDLFVIPLGCSVLALLLFYITDQIGLAIRLFFKDRIRPLVLKFVGRGRVISREDFSKVNDQLKTAEIKNEQLEQEKRVNRNTIHEQDQKAENAKNKVVDLDAKNKKLEEHIATLDSELKFKKEQLEDAELKLFKEKRHSKALTGMDLYKPSKSILYELSFNYPEKMEQHRWQVTTLEQSAQNEYLEFDKLIGLYKRISVSNSGHSYRDYSLEQPLKQVSALEFVIRPGAEYELYVECKKDIKNSKSFWFRCKQGSRKAGNKSNNSQDFMVEPMPLGDNWFVFQYPIKEDIENSFARFESLHFITGFRLRGSIDIARIRIYGEDILL